MDFDDDVREGLEPRAIDKDEMKGILRRVPCIRGDLQQKLANSDCEWSEGMLVFGLRDMNMVPSGHGMTVRFGEWKYMAIDLDSAANALLEIQMELADERNRATPEA